MTNWEELHKDKNYLKMGIIESLNKKVRFILMLQGHLKQKL